MPKYKFSEIAYNINQKKMPEPGDEEMYIGLEHLDSGSLKVKRWGSDVPITGEKLVMKKGDILFGRRNTYLRRAAIAPHDGIFSAHGMIFRPNTAVMDPDYFPFFIASDYFMNAAIRISVGSLSPTVNWKTLKDLEFVIPDLDSQRKSAAILTVANQLKESYETLLIQTDELVKSRFIELFSGTFEIVSAEDVCSDIVDCPHSTPKYDEIELTYPAIRTSEIQNGSISWDSMKYVGVIEYEKRVKRLKPERGDVVYAREGTYGDCVILPDEYKFCLGQRTEARSPQGICK